MLGGEAEAGRLLVGSVDWPTSSSFPSAWKETQGRVDGGGALWEVAVGRHQGAARGVSTALDVQEAFTLFVPVCTVRAVPVSLIKRLYLGSSCALNQDVGHTLFSFSRKAGRHVTVSVSTKYLATIILTGNNFV